MCVFHIYNPHQFLPGVLKEPIVFTYNKIDHFWVQKIFEMFDLFYVQFQIFEIAAKNPFIWINLAGKFINFSFT